MRIRPRNWPTLPSAAFSSSRIEANVAAVRASSPIVPSGDWIWKPSGPETIR